MKILILSSFHVIIGLCGLVQKFTRRSTFICICKWNKIGYCVWRVDLAWPIKITDYLKDHTSFHIYLTCLCSSLTWISDLLKSMKNDWLKPRRTALAYKQYKIITTNIHPVDFYFENKYMHALFIVLSWGLHVFPKGLKQSFKVLSGLYEQAAVAQVGIACLLQKPFWHQNSSTTTQLLCIEQQASNLGETFNGWAG